MLKHVSFTVMAVDWIAALVVAGNPQAGVRMAGAAAALRSALGGGMRPESSGLEGVRQIAGRSLDDETIERLWTEGGLLGLDEAVQYARDIIAVLLD
jgi:hypothetical protein